MNRVDLEEYSKMYSGSAVEEETYFKKADKFLKNLGIVSYETNDSNKIKKSPNFIATFKSPELKIKIK